MQGVLNHPRILSVATAQPAHRYSQLEILEFVRERMLGQSWAIGPEEERSARQLERLFASSRVEQRQSVVDLHEYYRRPRTTGERMVEYQTAGYALGRAAVEGCLVAAETLSARDVTDFVTVSCTGYGAPGLDIQLARDLGMGRDVRRVTIGHMGCFGALVGIRQCVATARAYAGSLAVLLSVELPC
jgi:alkylresorcinol/alkylpyrone synthase